MLNSVRQVRKPDRCKKKEDDKTSVWKQNQSNNQAKSVLEEMTYDLPEQGKMFLWLEDISKMCEETGDEEVKVTCFHSVSVPTVTLEALFEVLCNNVKHFVKSQKKVSSPYIEENVNASLLLYIAIYINRLVVIQKGVKYFSDITMHRIFIATLLLALKYLLDIPPSNSIYAIFCQLSKQEIDRLEAELIQVLGYRLHVTPKQFERMCNHISEYDE
jgi:hypothetical protein